MIFQFMTSSRVNFCAIRAQRVPYPPSDQGEPSISHRPINRPVILLRAGRRGCTRSAKLHLPVACPDVGQPPPPTLSLSLCFLMSEEVTEGVWEEALPIKEQPWKSYFSTLLVLRSCGDLQAWEKKGRGEELSGEGGDVINYQ